MKVSLLGELVGETHEEIVHGLNHIFFRSLKKMLSIGWGVRGRTYAKKTFYAEKNFHTQFADKTAFLLHS